MPLCRRPLRKILVYCPSSPIAEKAEGRIEATIFDGAIVGAYCNTPLRNPCDTTNLVQKIRPPQGGLSAVLAHLLG